MDLVVRDSSNHGKFVDKITRSDSYYFSRLSNLDRKRWVCEEHYRRQKLGIRTLSDETMSVMLATPGKRMRQANDPMNFDMLMDQSWASLWRYCPMVLCQEDQQ